ncbi:MAG: hypothetical protein ABSF84_03810 [Acidimicrobiales bacterium]
MDEQELLTQLAMVLDDELEQVHSLSYQFTVLASLVASDQSSWIPRSVSALQSASEELRLTDLRRAAVTIGVTTACGLQHDARLEEIVGELPDEWKVILDERRRVLLEEVADLQSVADLTISAVNRRSALAEEALAFLRSDDGSTYGRRSAPRPRIVRGAM